MIGLVTGAALAAVAALAYQRGAGRQWRDRLADRDDERRRLASDLETARLRENELEDRASVLERDLAEAGANLRNEREASREKLQLLEEAREKLKAEFENLAHRIFEEKNARLTGQNMERLQEILNPFKEQLGDFRKKVEDVYVKEGLERSTLLHEIKQLKDLNNRISKEATDLTHALKGESKTRGNWGEMILERVLEQSGLTNGREYETQVHLREKHGGQKERYPDVVVHLPEDRDVIIDSKVALNAYERYVNADDPEARKDALKQHVEAVRGHIKGLGAKRYQELEGIRPMELVLMCVPNEAAFLAAVSEEATLHDDALGQHVVLVGPTTLLLTLRIIATMWRTEYQNRNAIDIAERGQLLYDKLAGFVEDLESVGTALDKASSVYRDAHGKLTSGSGNLIGQANKLIELGVKARKKLPGGDA